MSDTPEKQLSGPSEHPAPATSQPMTDEQIAPEALSACPFCGKSGAARIVLASEMYPDEENYQHSESYAVMCDASSPNGPGGCGASGGFKQTEEAAIEAWQARASLSAQPAPSGEPVAWSPNLTYPDYEEQRVWANGKPRPEDVSYWTRQGISISYAYTAPQAPSVPDGWKPVDAEFFAYHADMGVVFFKTEDEARECCAENLKEERKEANSTGEWSDDLAESIRYGVVLGRAKFFPDNENPESGDYRMVDAAIDAAMSAKGGE